MTHKIGRIRRRARRAGAAPARGGVAARVAMLTGNLQAKLKVGPQNDAYEREADSVAARVMDGHSVAPAAGHAEGAMQRKCEECEAEEAQRKPLQRQAEEEEDELQMKRLPDVQRQGVEEEEEMVQASRLDGDLQRQAEEEEEEMLQAKPAADGSFTAGAGVSAQVAALRGGGQGLGSATRSWIEPRFGADFSDVRVHTGPQAHKAAKALNARAFTTGRDVVFGKGEYAPETRRGGELLAHELTHVIQQRGYKRTPGGRSEDAPVQRWQIGTAPVPALFPGGRTVPQGVAPDTEDHTARLAAARAIVVRLLGSTRCQNYFENNCDNGTATSLRDAFNSARVYHMDVGGTMFGGNPIGTNDIAYNRTAYRMGKWFLAATLLHEIYHVCAPTSPVADREWNAENALERCRLYSPFLRRVSPDTGAAGTRVTLTGWGLGPQQGPVDRVELNGTSCPVQSWTFNRASSMVTIVIEVPAGATSGDIRVLNNNVGSNPVAFTVT